MLAIQSLVTIEMRYVDIYLIKSNQEAASCMQLNSTLGQNDRDGACIFFFQKCIWRGYISGASCTYELRLETSNHPHIKKTQAAGVDTHELF
jgi:hypothetical protein